MGSRFPFDSSQDTRGNDNLEELPGVKGNGIIINMHDIFERIIKKEIPSKIFYEDDDVIVIQDIKPKAPVHLLLIPKKKTKNFYETPQETLSLLDATVKKVAKMLGIIDHFRIQVNNGLGQEIDHVHYHFLSDKGADKL